MHGFGTFTWKERREANNLTYLVILLPWAGIESSKVPASWDMKVYKNENNGNENHILINCIINWWTKFYFQSDCLLIT